MTFSGKFFSFKSVLFSEVVNIPLYFFPLVCTLLLRKTKSKYRSGHNERITMQNKSISAKKMILENVSLLN